MMSKGHDGHNGTTHFKGTQTFILEALKTPLIWVWRMLRLANQDHPSAIIASGRCVRCSMQESLRWFK